jgi:hypothetical protein
MLHISPLNILKGQKNSGNNTQKLQFWSKNILQIWAINITIFIYNNQHLAKPYTHTYGFVKTEEEKSVRKTILEKMHVLDEMWIGWALHRERRKIPEAKAERENWVISYSLHKMDIYRQSCWIPLIRMKDRKVIILIAQICNIFSEGN